MKINNNPQMQSFFERCFFNMGNEEINDYIGVTFLPEQEKELQRELSEVGAIEFQGPESEWPSLYISTEEYLKTAYQSHIQLDQIKSDAFEFRKQTMPPYTLFNVSVIQEDPNRELNDSLMLRALDAPYEPCKALTAVTVTVAYILSFGFARAEGGKPCYDALRLVSCD